MTTFSDLQKDIVSRLKLSAGADDVREFETRLIIENVTGLNFSELITTDIVLTQFQEKRISSIVNERNFAKPLGYILGQVNFYGLDIEVDDRVLIPRSETEQVVEKALEQLRINQDKAQRVIDIGTGSGAIALVVAANIENVEVLALDISNGALDVAKRNYENLKANLARGSKIIFQRSDCFNNVDREHLEKYDLIISNPPYIGEDEKDTLEDSVKEYEPHIALFADDEGFAIYERIIIESVNWLKRGGYLVLEIAPRHVDKTKEFMEHCEYSDIQILKDLAGRDRIAIAKS